MSSPEIEEFARLLVQHVRDTTIQACDRNFQPSAGNPIARRWRRAALDTSPEAFAKTLIPDIVDSTLAHLLAVIDQDLLRLSFAAANGKATDLTAIAKNEGELSGWYGGGDSWREKYSKERFVDDTADLKADDPTQP